MTTLQTIKRNGWATDEVFERVGKPDKKVFTITESGREEFNRCLAEDNTMSAINWKKTVEFGVMYIEMYFNWVNKCKNGTGGDKR